MQKGLIVGSNWFKNWSGEVNIALRCWLSIVQDGEDGSALMVESLEAQVDSRMPRTVLLSVARVRGVRQMVACLILRCPSPQVWRKL